MMLLSVFIWVDWVIVCWLVLVCMMEDVLMEQLVRSWMKLIPVCMDVFLMGVCGHFIWAWSGLAVNIVATVFLMMILWWRLLVTSILSSHSLVVSLLNISSAIDFSQFCPYLIVIVGAQVHVGLSVQSRSRSLWSMCVLSSLMAIFLSKL